MRKLKSLTLVATLATFAVMPGQAEAQEIFSGQFTGGSNFATTMTGTLTFLANSLVQLDITNQGPGVFAAIGLVNAPGGISAGSATPNSDGWRWEATHQLSGDGLAPSTWAWVAPHNGLGVGDNQLSFLFNVGNLTFADLQNVGFGVHSIAYEGCSTKFGVWDGGYSDNDVGPDGYGDCVSVPEPASTTLLATGLMGLAVIVRRRRGAELVDEDGENTEI
jgi:hypothetical protein